MRTLYIDCGMGAAGDMLMASLYELLPEHEKQAFLEKMNSLDIPGVSVTAETKETCGITGTHVRVKVFGQEEGAACGHGGDHHHHGHDHDCARGSDDHHHAHDCGHGHDHDYAHNHGDDHGHQHHHDHAHGDGHHHNSGLGEICQLIEGLDLPDKVKVDARAVYEIIAGAESRVHGKTVDQIHFHEVGTLDAVADVVGNCLLMDLIKPDQVVASPVHVGSGTVKCAHGVLPVPAPATALILQGVPIYGGEIKGELCTPTGAALLKYFISSFGSMPAMRTSAIGYGIGIKEFPQANCVRTMLGEDEEQAVGVIELAANLDDMTAEEIGFAMEILFEAGALDVYAESIVMKKSRPAVKLVCMARPEDREAMAALMLKHTTTIGLREYRCGRITMERSFEKRQTPWGEIDVKLCEKDGLKKEKAEFDQLAALAREHGLSIGDVRKAIEKKDSDE